jgi:tetratricopeptide (TPR) repeat protein
MIKRTITLCLLILLYLPLAGQNTIDRNSSLNSFNRGLALLESNNYAAARSIFEQYIQSEPSSEMLAEAKYYQAYCAMMLFNDDAEYLFENFVADYPSNPKSLMAYYELGNYYYRNNKFKEAISSFEKVKAYNLTPTQRFELKFKMGYSYFNLKNFDNALENFKYSLQADNAFQGASAYYAGFIEIEREQYDDALPYLKIAEEKEAYKNVVPPMITKVYYGKKDYDQVIAYAQSIFQAGRSVKNISEMELMLADAYYFTKDYRNAYRYFESSLERKGGKSTAQVLYKAGFTAYQSGFFSQAVDYLKKAALDKGKTGQYASYYLGLSYLRLDNKPFAITAFENASKHEFDKKIQYESMFYLGKLNFEEGRYSAAIPVLTAYNQSEHASINREEVDELISKSYLLTEDVNAAIEYIESLPVKTDKVKQVYQLVTYRKATSLFNAGRYSDAVKTFYISLDYPYDQETTLASYFWIGEAYAIGKRLDEARNAYETVLKKDPSNVSESTTKTRYGLGYTYFNLRDYNRALPQFKLYVDKTSSNPGKYFYKDALLRLADCYYATKEYRTSISIYNKAIQSGSHESDYCNFQIGLIYGILGENSQAIAYLNKVTETEQSVYFDDALFQKAELSFESGEYNRAIQGFSFLIQDQAASPFVPYALINRAISYSNLQQHDNSINDYIMVIDNYPRHEAANNALMGLQEVLSNNNRSDEFAEYLEKYKLLNPDGQDLSTIEFDAAKNLYFNQNYSGAITAFNEYLNDYGQNSFEDEVYYYLGESNYRAKDYENAITAFESVIRIQNTKWKNRSIRRLAMLNDLVGDYGKTLEYYNQLEKVAANKREEYDAWEGLMKAYFNNEKYDSTIYYALKILETGTYSVNTQNLTQLYAGKAYLAKGQFQEAIDYFLATVNTAKDVNGAEAQYLIAKIFYDEGQFQNSNEALFDLNENYGIYEEWVGNSFLLIADNYIAMDEIFQAKATLNSVMEKSPNETIVATAREKLLEIDAITEKEIIEVDTLQEQDY